MKPLMQISAAHKLCHLGGYQSSSRTGSLYDTLSLSSKPASPRALGYTITRCTWPPPSAMPHSACQVCVLSYHHGWVAIHPELKNKTCRSATALGPQHMDVRRNNKAPQYLEQGRNTVCLHTVRGAASWVCQQASTGKLSQGVQRACAGLVSCMLCRLRAKCFSCTTAACASPLASASRSRPSAVACLRCHIFYDAIISWAQIVTGPSQAPATAMCLLCQPGTSFLQGVLTPLQADCQCILDPALCNHTLRCQLLRRKSICSLTLLACATSSHFVYIPMWAMRT